MGEVLFQDMEYLEKGVIRLAGWRPAVTLQLRCRQAGTLPAAVPQRVLPCVAGPPCGLLQLLAQAMPCRYTRSSAVVRRRRRRVRGPPSMRSF